MSAKRWCLSSSKLTQMWLLSTRVSRSQHKKTPRYHLNRILSVFRTALSLVLHSQDAEKTIYTVYESRFGVIYNYLILLLARAFRYRIFLHHHTSAHTLAKSARFSILASIAGGNALHIALSEKMACDLRRNYRSVRRVMVCGNACHVHAPSGVPDKAEVVGTCRIGMLSNLNFRKRVECSNRRGLPGSRSWAQSNFRYCWSYYRARGRLCSRKR